MAWEHGENQRRIVMSDSPADLMQVAQILNCALDNGLVIFRVRQPDGSEGFITASPHTVLDGIRQAQLALVGEVIPWIGIKKRRGGTRALSHA
jgi:hypothetical protein